MVYHVIAYHISKYYFVEMKTGRHDFFSKGITLIYNFFKIIMHMSNGMCIDIVP